MSTNFKKTLAAFVLVAVAAFAAKAPVAKAATIEELQAMIAQLTAQLAALSGGSSSASCYSHTVTLKQGSTGSQVMKLQAALGAGADGKFGPMTKAKVQAFQASKGLTADGVVGPVTGAAVAASCATTPTTPTNPNTNVGLQGGAGTALITSTSVDVEDEVMEGMTEKVHGFRVEAQDSDIRVTNVRVSIENNDYPTSTRRPDRVLKEVSVWMGDTKVGSIDPMDMTRDGNVYSRSISLNNAVVKKGQANRANFYIGFTALNNIDTADMPGDWGVGVSEIRTVDGSGAIMTSSYDTLTGSSPDSFGIEFTDTASAGDIKMRVSTGSNNPVAGNVEVSDTGSTSNVTMLEFRLKAEGTDMVVDSMVFNVTGTGATPAEIASQLQLMRGNTVLADLTSLGSNGNKTFDLYDDLTIEEGDTETFKVVAKINKIDVGNFGQGDSLDIDWVSTSVEDVNGNDMTSFSGSAPGETQTFYSEGIIFTKKSGWTISTTTDTGGNITSATYTMKVGATAFGNTFYVGQSVQAATTGSGTGSGANAFAYWLENSSAPSTAVIGGTKTATVTSNAPVQGSSWRLDEGTEREFTIVVNLIDPTTGSASWRVQLGSMRTFSDSGLTADAANNTLTPDTDYETAYQLIIS